MIRLEKFGPEDFNQLIDWVDTKEVMMNWSGSLFSFPLTEKSLEWYIEDSDDMDTADSLAYKVIDEESGKAVGHISLGGISRKNRSARISRVLIGETNMRGRGLCKAITTAIVKIGFEELNLHRISLGVYHFNTAAIRCYESAGFKIEGVSRDILLHNGEYWSLVEMSMLEDEYRALNKQI